MDKRDAPPIASASLYWPSTMISLVFFGLPERSRASRYFDGVAAGATRLRLPSDPLPLALNLAPAEALRWVARCRGLRNSGDTPFGFNRCARRSVLARRRGHTAEASRRVLTFSGDLLAPTSWSRQVPRDGTTERARFDLNQASLLDCPIAKASPSTTASRRGETFLMRWR